jgi:hypothetical protein
VATALYPAADAETRPGAVALVDKESWQSAVAGAVLAGSPLNAPLLLTDGDSVPEATEATLEQLDPKGEALSKGAEVILVGDDVPVPSGFKSGRVHGRDPYSIAAAVDSFHTAIVGRPAATVLVVSAEQPGYAMPAAAWAARSGQPVLFVGRNTVPPPTKRAIEAHENPEILVIGPPTVISTRVERELEDLGDITRIQSRNPGPVALAADFARSKKLWGADHPGRNYSLANIRRPADAAAAAGLGSNGVFAPLLLTDSATVMPPALEGYFLDVQPGYENDDPSEAVYNRVWILGNKDAVSQTLQTRMDRLVQLVPVDRPPKQ